MRFPYDLRFEHCYIPGKNGHGKTTLLKRLALWDIQQGAGITFIDPKGTAVKELLTHIPRNRINDCVYIDWRQPVPLDFFSYDGPHEKDELVKDFTFLLLKGIDNAPLATELLTNILYTLLTTNVPTCFLDVYHFLQNSIRQQELIAGLPDRHPLRFYWKNESINEQSKRSVRTRMNEYVQNTMLSALFGCRDPKHQLSIAEAMNNRKILLVNLGGASRTAVEYGSIIVAKIRQEIFRRSNKPKPDWIPHFLFIDEFHKFPNPETFSDLLTMSREFRLACTLANQTIQDIEYAKIQNGLSIISHNILFALNPKDTPFFPAIKAYAEKRWNLNLSFIPKYSAVYQIGSDIAYEKTKPPLDPSSASYADEITKRTNEYFTCTCPPISYSAASVQSGTSNGDEKHRTLLSDRPETRRIKKPR